MNQTTHLPFLLALLGIVAVASIPSSVLAQDQRLYRSNELPSAEELIDSLNPNSPTRGIRVVPKGKQAATEPARASVSMQINFEFNSYNLTTNALPHWHETLIGSGCIALFPRCRCDPR